MTTAALVSESRYLGSGTGSVSAGVSTAAGYLASQFKRLAFETMRTARGQAAALPSHLALVDGYREAASLVPSGSRCFRPLQRCAKRYSFLKRFRHGARHRRRPSSLLAQSRSSGTSGQDAGWSLRSKELARLNTLRCSDWEMNSSEPETSRDDWAGMNLCSWLN